MKVQQPKESEERDVLDERQTKRCPKCHCLWAVHTETGCLGGTPENYMSCGCKEKRP
jgi:hypothetical protein